MYEIRKTRTNWKKKFEEADEDLYDRATELTKLTDTYHKAKNDNHDKSLLRYNQLKDIVVNPFTPDFIIDQLMEMYGSLIKEVSCDSCLDIIQSGQLKITRCNHKFCKACYDRQAVRDSCDICLPKNKYAYCFKRRERPAEIIIHRRI